MKKIIFSIAAAAMAMDACTQTDVVYEDGSEIGHVPVNYTATKLNYGPVDGTTYPETESFGVFAQHTANPAGTDFPGTVELNPYLVNVKFSSANDGTGTWKGADQSYYWPRTGSLYFAGYSPYGMNGTPDYYFNQDGSASLNITDFTQGNYAYTDGTAVGGNEMIDLMWFDVTSTSASTGAPAVTFKHALSYLSFYLKTSVDNLYTIKSITLSGVNNKGNFASNRANDGTDNPSWSDLSGAENTISLYNTNKALVNGTDFIIDDVLVIPQTTGTLTIEYTMKGAGEGAPEIEQTFSRQLTGGTSQTAEDQVWYYGKHYSYFIEFKADEIRLTPDVSEWTPISRFINNIN